MLMHDINLLLPSAIRTMRSLLRDVSRQQIPFTVDGLVRQGLPEKFAEQLRSYAKETGGERLMAARFVAELFRMNGENYAAKESLQKWLASHEKGQGDLVKQRAVEVLKAWSEDEFGPGEYRSFSMDESSEDAEPQYKSFIYRMM